MAQLTSQHCVLLISARYTHSRLDGEVQQEQAATISLSKCSGRLSCALRFTMNRTYACFDWELLMHRPICIIMQLRRKKILKRISASLLVRFYEHVIGSPTAVNLGSSDDVHDRRTAKLGLIELIENGALHNGLVIWVDSFFLTNNGREEISGVLATFTTTLQSLRISNYFQHLNPIYLLLALFADLRIMHCKELRFTS